MTQIVRVGAMLLASVSRVVVPRRDVHRVNGLGDEQDEDADQSDLFKAHWCFLQPSDSLSRGLPVRRDHQWYRTQAQQNE
jgi:hypothetical protein